MKSLNETKWLLTGGTSGLGLALTETLIQHGAKVAVVARNETALYKLAERIPIIPIRGDVGKKEDILKIVGTAHAQLGAIDVLVNNASTLGVRSLKNLADTECEELEDALTTNLVGPFRLIKAVIPGMLLRASGMIINISSDAALNAYPEWGAYGTSKAALDHLSKIWSNELREKGIRFLAVDPGDMDTPLHEQAVPGADRSELKSPLLAARQLLTLIASEQSDSNIRRAL